MPNGREVGLDPSNIVLDGTHLPLPKKGPEPPIFGPCLLWTNGWVDQDATWYGGRHRPRRRCVTQLPLPKKGHSPQFSAQVYCGQTAGWTKIPLGTEIDLGPGHMVLDRDPAPPVKRAQQPLFSADVYRGHGRPPELLLTSC